MSTVLNPAIFDLKVNNHELIKLSYDAYLANARSSHAKTLKRGEVRGGGKKPWKQKGTGRARFGSTRNPIWRHGGVAFGRTGEENFTKKISKTAKRVAIAQALSLKNTAGQIQVVDTPALKAAKTKLIAKFLADNKLSQTDKTLFVVKEKTTDIIRATNNLPQLKLVHATYLNVFDLINADKVVFTKEALPVVEAWLLGKEQA